MKNIMKEAHRLTKEIKREYPSVDYKFQLGLCISYLYENEKKENAEMVELKGTEKQVKWAEDIRSKFETALEEGEKVVNARIESIIAKRKNNGKYKETDREKLSYITTQYNEVKEFVLNQNKATFFIDYRNIVDTDYNHICSKFDILFDIYESSTGKELKTKVRTSFDFRTLNNIG